MTKPDPLVCWKCGAELKGVILPLSRREVCVSCKAEQHVCKLCRHYDPKVADMCREERAESVSNKERANFCDYFDPRPGAYAPAAGGAEAARRQLAALFGGETASASDAKSEAMAELEKLFSDGKKRDG